MAGAWPLPSALCRLTERRDTLAELGPIRPRPMAKIEAPRRLGHRGAWPEAQAHSALHAENQRQGRTLHPNQHRCMGLCHALPQLSRAQACHVPWAARQHYRKAARRLERKAASKTFGACANPNPRAWNGRKVVGSAGSARAVRTAAPRSTAARRPWTRATTCGQRGSRRGSPPAPSASTDGDSGGGLTVVRLRQAAASRARDRRCG